MKKKEMEIRRTVRTEPLCPAANALYDGYFLGNGDLVMSSVRSSIAVLLTEPTATPDVLEVWRAVKRLWILKRHWLVRERVAEVVQHRTDVELVAFMGLCRVETLAAGPDGAAAALPRFADAVNDLCGTRALDAARGLGARELGAALTLTSDAWHGIVPGERALKYAAAASLAMGACAAVIEWPGQTTPNEPLRNHPGWFDGGMLTAGGAENVEAMCWGVIRSAVFLVDQLRVADCDAFALPAATRARAVEVLTTRIVPQLDPTQLAESSYNRYLSGSSQPGDCALYARQTGHRPCTVTEAIQFVRRSVYREALNLLKCETAAAVRDVGWPEGTHRALARRLSQFVRETVLAGAMGMYCTVRGGVVNRIKSYSALELAEIGWWVAPDIAYPCIVHAGAFWVLIGADMRPRCHCLDVVDAVALLMASISDVDRSCDSLLNKLELGQAEAAPM